MIYYIIYIENIFASIMMRQKKPIKDADIIEIFAIRDSLIEKASDEKEKESIHLACKGIFKCPKSATAAEKKKCFDSIKKKLDALGGKKKKGGRRKSRSKSRSKSRRRTGGKSRSKSRRRRSK
jgi:hypothetical protein